MASARVGAAVAYSLIGEWGDRRGMSGAKLLWREGVPFRQERL